MLQHNTGAAKKDLLRSVFILLSRYQAVSGAGFQCSLPPAVFECLEALWGVECEGFASPFNCYFGANRYCSAFADTDMVFGSRGSFFQQDIKRGSFELNPPFSFELYEAVAAHCNRLL